MNAVDPESTPIRIYDIVRTGTDFSSYWKYRSPNEKTKPTDLLLKLPLHVDPCAFQPIPLVNTPGEDPNIAADWLTTVVGSTEIKILTATPLTSARELTEIELPLIITQESWTGLVRQMENMCLARLAETDTTHAIETKRLVHQNHQQKNELDRLTARLAEINESTTDIVTKNDAGKTKRIATPATTTKKPAGAKLTQIKAERDALLIEKTSLQASILTLNTTIDGLNKQLAGKQKRIEDKEKFIQKLFMRINNEQTPQPGTSQTNNDQKRRRPNQGQTYYTTDQAHRPEQAIQTVDNPSTLLVEQIATVFNRLQEQRKLEDRIRDLESREAVAYKRDQGFYGPNAPHQ